MVKHSKCVKSLTFSLNKSSAGETLTIGKGKVPGEDKLLELEGSMAHTINHAGLKYILVFQHLHINTFVLEGTSTSITNNFRLASMYNVCINCVVDPCN
jgi:hypothetical protein